MHSELSEALEYFRDGVMPITEVQYEHHDPPGWSNSPTRDSGKGPVPGKPIGVAIEFADALIRIFDTCEHYKIPLEEALRIKLEFNKSRPYRHGGKKI
jgi:hypothetical protein